MEETVHEDAAMLVTKSPEHSKAAGAVLERCQPWPPIWITLV
ncbi:hypothetical protein M7I_6779 [Glarea lozoyensis 74030]|uniref:Uncharacterized protein n=1 Tax=Glarea lozoyensis (strain ATCC 74030 / MF5533) TaxID=1104152 RepID=H0EVI1_GLAL7|nr:hypothetical protein M7I_6779 [Glarea lozoyensis 74030]